MADVHEPATIPERPLLPPWYRVVGDGDRLLLEHGQSLVVLEGAAVRTLLPTLLPLLDGTRTLDMLVERLGAAARPAIELALGLLAAHHLLVEGPDAARELRAAAHAVAAAYDLPPAVAAERLGGARIGVVGRSPAGVEIARLLHAAGIGEVVRLLMAGWTRGRPRRGRPGGRRGRRASRVEPGRARAGRAVAAGARRRRPVRSRRATRRPGRVVLLRVPAPPSLGQPRLRDRPGRDRGGAARCRDGRAGRRAPGRRGRASRRPLDGRSRRDRPGCALHDRTSAGDRRSRPIPCSACRAAAPAPRRPRWRPDFPGTQRRPCDLGPAAELSDGRSRPTPASCARSRNALCTTAEPAIFRAVCEVGRGAALLGASLDHLAGIGGSGLSREAAAAAAVGEALERYSATWIPRERLVVASARELGAAAVAPERFALFSERQYADPRFPFRRFTPESRIAWVDATMAARP